MLTIIHELGHWIDHKVLQSRTHFASMQGRHAGDPMHEWWQAVQASESVQKIQGWKLARGSDLKKHQEYLLQPWELWARSYAQFVAEESGQPEANAWLDKIRSGKTGYVAQSQWSAQDFAPIRTAMRRLFAAKKWMTLTP